MKRNIYLASLLMAMGFMPFITCAQDYASLKRLSLDTALAPFYHGVASGDPLDTAVIIWTRITTQDSNSINVLWQVATDTAFTNIVQSGIYNTDGTKDFTVKVDVYPLQPNTFYYYRFKYRNNYSLIGRTKTAPTGNVTNLRFAVVSCSDYQNGYFNAYYSLMKRNDFDAVIHLGDYIYEYEVGLNIPDREHEPIAEIVSLSDYRARFSHYHLDEQLRGLRQNYPFITIWDDHETADNSWTGGADNHDGATEGNWVDRLNNSKTAYFEWMPIRDRVSLPQFRGYRSIRYGNLADIIIIDSRIEGRDSISSDPNVMADSNRHLLGIEQADWLEQQLRDTVTQWKIIANQVMMAPLKFGGQVFNPSQWDGYEAERQRIYDNIINNNIDDVVVITGDIHCAWANNLISGGNNVAVEFVATSITSAASSFPMLETAIKTTLPYVKYVDLTKKGFLILDINTTRTQGDFYAVNTITSLDTTSTFEEAWYTNSGANVLTQGSRSTATTTYPPLAPNSPAGIVSINERYNTELVLLGAFPNPFHDRFVVQYYLEQPGIVNARIFDLSGKVVSSQNLGERTQGVNLANVDGSKLPAGNYILVMENGKQTYRKQITKVR